MEYLWIYYRNDKELTFEKRFWMWFEPCILYPFKWKVESGKWKENAKSICMTTFPLSATLNILDLHQNGHKNVCPFLVFTLFLSN